MTRRSPQPLGSIGFTTYGYIAGYFAAKASWVLYVFGLVVLIGGYAITLRKRYWERKLAEAQAERDALDDIKPTLTARQMVLLERMNDDDYPHRIEALIELWTDIYGHEPDMDRPLLELSTEVSMALRQMTS